MAYKGMTTRLPVGAQGFTGTRNQSQAGPGHLIYTEGAELEGGIIRKDGGAKLMARIGAYTSMRTILHFDDPVEGSTTFVDDGFSPTAWTAVGDAKTTLTDFKFGPSALILDGTGDWITGIATGLPILANEFTLHMWFKCQAAAGSQKNLGGQCDAVGSAASTSFIVFRTTGNLMRCQFGQGSSLLTLTSTTQFHSSLNNGWIHLAIVRDNAPLSGNLLRLFINGLQEAQLAISGSINTSGSLRAVGQLGALTTNPWQGLVDEMVLEVGSARWRANFTPPTAPQKKYGPGAVPPHDTVIPITAGTSWASSIGQDEDVIGLDNGSILCDPGRQGDFSTILREGLIPTQDPPPYFCVGGGEAVGQPPKLFYFSRTNQLQVRIGSATSFAAISTPPADWAGGGNYPTFGCTHLHRLFAGGNASDPHRLYYSDVLDHQKFTGSGAGAAGTIAIYPGQGEKLVGAYSIRGALVLWKFPVGVYVLTTPDADPVNWQVEVLSRSVGAVNADCIIQIENDLLYLDRTGEIHSLAATTDFGDFNTSNISEVADLNPFMKEQVNRGRIQRSRAVYYVAKRQAWFMMPRSNSDVPNLRLQLAQESLMQQQGGNLPRFFLSRRDVATALWMRPDNIDGVLKPAIGDQEGGIYVLDDDLRNKDDIAYDMLFSTANTDLSFVDPALATRSKNGQFLEIVYEPEGEWDLLVDIFWDDKYIETVPFNMGGAGGVIGELVLGDGVLGSSGVKEARRRITGSGRRFRLTCSNDGLNQNVAIAEFHLSFTVGDERTPE